MKLIDGNEDYETFKRGYDLLYLCNNREIKPLENRPAIPPMYIGMVECDLANITAKSEFPLHSVEVFRLLMYTLKKLIKRKNK